jgi:single-strand DNA-binding protein
MTNIVVLGGNVCFTPELKYTPAGTAVCTLRLASNSKYVGRDGQAHEKVVFVDVVAWGKTAEACAEYLDKGSKVMVEGALELNEWTDRTTQQKRSKLEVRASRVDFLTMKTSNGSAAPVAAGERNDANEDVPF